MIAQNLFNRSMLGRFFLLVLVAVFLFTPHPSFAGYVSTICVKNTGANATCDISEVGPFMQYISAECGNTGKCNLTDLMQVVNNVGNYILKITGALLMLFYVYGGFCYILAHGDKDWITKGKNAIKTSTIGLVIIVSAWLGIHALFQAFTGKSVEQYQQDITDVKAGFVKCGSDATEGKNCAVQSVCKAGKCISLCEAEQGGLCKSVDPNKLPSNCLPTTGLCPEGGVCCKK